MLALNHWENCKHGRASIRMLTRFSPRNSPEPPPQSSPRANRAQHFARSPDSHPLRPHYETAARDCLATMISSFVGTTQICVPLFAVDRQTSPLTDSFFA